MKVSIAGDAGVGKSTFIKRIKERVFSPKYIATLGVDVSLFPFEGKVLEFWDCAGKESFMGLGDGYYINSKSAIVMCDFFSKLSLENLVLWINKIEKICGKIPIAICANKSDIQRKEFDEEMLYLFYNKIKNNHPNLVGCFTLSTKEGSGLFEPLRSIIH